MHHVKDEMLEPNPKIVFGGPIRRWKDLESMPGVEMFLKMMQTN
jgi:hypothetical protein